MVAPVGTLLRAHVGRPTELTHRDDERVVENSLAFEVGHQRGEQVVEQRQQGAESLLDSTVRRNVVTVRIPGARGTVVAEVERDERHARLHEASRQERLLTPEMGAIGGDDGGIFTREIKRHLGLPAEHDIERLLRERIGRFQRAALVEVAAELVELRVEIATIRKSIGRQACGETEQAAAAAPPGVDSDIGVDGQTDRVGRLERVVLLAEVAAVGEVTA